jgi:hypothetical protein
MKIVVFTRTDFINGVAFSPGEICGWPDHVADRLVAKGFATLYGDGKPKVVDGKIPLAKDWWDNAQLAEHVDKLKREGKFSPPPPVVVIDPEVQRAARERARVELNQI